MKVWLHKRPVCQSSSNACTHLSLFVSQQETLFRSRYETKKEWERKTSGQRSLRRDTWVFAPWSLWYGPLFGHQAANMNKIFIPGFKPIILLGFFAFLYWDCKPLCPTYSTLDSVVCVSGATMKREPGSFGDKRNMQSVGDNTEEQWKPNPKRTPRAVSTSCKQDSASRKDVRPNSHNVLQPQDYFYLFFSNSPRYALSATAVMLPFWSCCICSYKITGDNFIFDVSCHDPLSCSA